MGLAPCLLLALLAVHHVASLGAPQPLSSLDAKNQEIIDCAVVQLQVSCRVQGIWEYYHGTLFSGWRAWALQKEAQDGEIQPTGKKCGWKGVERAAGDVQL